MSEKAEPQLSDRDGRKTFYNLMKRDVSWQAIKDVLAYEIPLFGTSSDDDIVKVLVSRGYVSRERLDELKANTDLIGDSIGQALIDRGMITAAQLAEAKRLKRQTGQPLYRALMQLRLAVPQDLKAVLTAPIRLPFGHRSRDAFGAWIVEHQLATDEQLDAAWREARAQKEDFRHRLLQTGILSEEEYAQAVAHESSVPFDDLAGVHEVPAKLTRLLPPFLLRRHHALPFKLVGRTLHVAFPEAHHVREFEKLGLMLDFDVQPVIAPRTLHADLSARHLPVDDADLAVSLGDGLADTADMLPAVELLTAILRGLLRSNGTDVHLEPQPHTVRVRYRVDGILHDVMTLDPGVAHKIVLRLKAMAQMDIAQQLLPQDGHVIVPIGDQPHNFRIATMPTVDGEKMAIRLVQSDLAFSSFEQLGMNAAQRRLVTDILALPNGLVLVSGPVGSGKTTTLYSFLSSLDCFTRNIVTIEEPVEYEMSGVNQTQVNAKRGLTFAVGLRAIMRQDPDVIMVGEIRDEETAETAARAAMTGTLVLSTMHGNSAITCLYSLIQLGVRSYMVSLATAGIVFQRLARRICPHCREARPATAADRAELGAQPDEVLELYRGAGCVRCLHTGYAGRIGVFEVLKVNDEYREAIVSQPSLASLTAATARAETISLRQHAAELVRAGVISLEEMTRIL